MDKPWKVVLAFIGVFVAGAVFGGLFTLRATGKRPVEKAVVTPPPPAQAAQPAPAKAPASVGPALMRQFTRKLKPTPEQREKIDPLVGRAGEDLQRLNVLARAQDRENLENVTRVMERMYEDVAAWLTPEQRIELAEMRRQWQEKVAAERKKRSEPTPASAAGRKTDPAKTPAGKDPAAKKTDPAKQPRPAAP